MSQRRNPTAWACLLVFAVASAGCQAPPRVVIGDLPGPSILAPRPEPPRPAATEDVRSPLPAKAPQPWVPTANERPWRWIVIHHSATDLGSAEIFDRAHRAKGWDELGYHFVVTNGSGGEDGQVQVGSRWRKQKWGAHCGGTPNNEYNNFGVGICLVGEFSDKLPSPAQLASLQKLVFFLADRYGIHPSCLIGHRDAPGKVTVCPGSALHHYINTHLRPALERRQQLAGQ